MKAVRFHEYGGIDVLRYEEVDRPRPVRARFWFKSRAPRSTRSTHGSERGSLTRSSR
jgi:hypothetical protein